jgi:hypothetical protein
MQKAEITDYIKLAMPRVIKKEHEFRIEYLHKRYIERTTMPRSPYFQLEEATLWMGLYTHINWLAHFRFLKSKGVDGKVPEWIAEVFGWPTEYAEAFWACGRNPLAHTGNRSQGYSENIKGIKYYIGLNLDNQEDWNGGSGYMAASPMKKDIGGSPLPAQQVIFFYPAIEAMLTRLHEDIASAVAVMSFDQLKSLSVLMGKMPFIKDDGTLHQVSEQIRVYKYAV